MYEFCRRSEEVVDATSWNLKETKGCDWHVIDTPLAFDASNSLEPSREAWKDKYWKKHRWRWKSWSSKDKISLTTSKTTARKGTTLLFLKSLLKTCQDNLEPGVRITTERRIAGLEQQLSSAEVSQKERKYASKYHMVKFFGTFSLNLWSTSQSRWHDALWFIQIRRRLHVELNR